MYYLPRIIPKAPDSRPEMNPVREHSLNGMKAISCITKSKNPVLQSRNILGLLAFLVLFAVTETAVSDQAGNIRPDTQTVFGKFSDRVVKIEVIENESGAKAVVGSGFFVSAEGHIVTNYHVISKLVHHPKRYHAEFVNSSETSGSLRILGIDVIHDLAIVQAEEGTDRFFKLTPIQLEQGTRLYSLGYPHDIGLSIVEGTYNGLLEHTLYKKIHFTGSINPGMSGGPTIMASGKVVGVNVSSGGNQVSFLVPMKTAAELLAKTLDPTSKTPGDFLEIVRAQLLAHQDIYLSDSLMKSNESVQLGNYKLPSKLAPFFNCWADATRNKIYPYEIVTHQCSTDDYLYISSDHWSGIIQFRHRLITSEELNRFRFYELYSNYFDRAYGTVYGSEEEVTQYRCNTDIVKHNGITFKTVFCVRRYLKLDGLYDAVFKAATLDSNNSGLETTLVLSGVSFEKAERLAREYLEAISWKK